MLATPTIAVLWALSALWTWASVTLTDAPVGAIAPGDYLALPLVALGPPLVAAVAVLPVAVRRDTAADGPPVGNVRTYEYGAWLALALGTLTAVVAGVWPGGTLDRVDVLVLGTLLVTGLDTAVSVAYLRERASRVGLAPLPSRSA